MLPNNPMAALAGAMKLPNIGSYPSPEGRAIYEFLRKADRAKAVRQASSWVHREYYLGRGWYDYNAYSNAIAISPYLRQGVQWNASAVAINRAASSVMSVDLMLEGMSRTTDAADKRSAEVLTQVLQDHDLRNNSAAKLRDLMTMTLVTGTMFRRVSYDETLPEITVLSAEELQMATNMGLEIVSLSQQPDGRYRVLSKIGGTVEHTVPGNLVFIETGVYNWEDVRRFAVVDYIPIRTAIQKFPNVDPSIFKPMNIQNTLSSNTDGSVQASYATTSELTSQQYGSRVNADYGVTWIVEYWEKSGPYWDRQVRTGLMLEHAVLEREALPMNPYIMYSCYPHDDIWAKSMMQDIYKLQFAVNLLTTKSLEYLAECVKDVVMTPYGAEMSPISNEYSLHIQYDPTFGPPQFKPMDGSVLAILGGVQDKFKAGIYELSGINDIAMGSVRPRTNRASIEAAINAADSPLLDIRNRMKTSERQRGKVVAALAQQFYDYPRLSKITGNTGAVAIREFSNADIILGTDVTIIESENALRSKEERFDVATQLARFGVFDANPEAKDRRRMMQGFIESGRLEELTPIEERQAIDQALIEQEAIVSGNFELLPPEAQEGADGDPILNAPMLAFRDELLTPMIDPSQLHDIHVMVHRELLNDPTMPAQLKPILQLHIDQHQFFIRQEEEQAFQADLERRRQISVADAAGTLMTTVASADAAAENKAAEVKSNPAAGGVQSGKVRAR